MFSNQRQLRALPVSMWFLPGTAPAPAIFASTILYSRLLPRCQYGTGGLTQPLHSHWPYQHHHISTSACCLQDHTMWAQLSQTSVLKSIMAQTRVPLMVVKQYVPRLTDDLAAAAAPAGSGADSAAEWLAGS
jgi:hypothetical protein